MFSERRRAVLLTGDDHFNQCSFDDIGGGGDQLQNVDRAEIVSVEQQVLAQQITETVARKLNKTSCMSNTASVFCCSEKSN